MKKVLVVFVVASSIAAVSFAALDSSKKKVEAKEQKAEKKEKKKECKRTCFFS